MRVSLTAISSSANPGAGFAPRLSRAAGGDGASPASGRRRAHQRAAASGDGLTAAERQIVQQLAEIDRHVRAHEQAHLAVAGIYATGGPSFEYVVGPDGRRYAVGGDVTIDYSPVPGDPEATIRKAEIVQAAANAPADPSLQDRQVAAAAARMEQEARQELAQLERLRRAEQQRAAVAAYTQEEPALENGSAMALLA